MFLILSPSLQRSCLLHCFTRPGGHDAHHHSVATEAREHLFGYRLATHHLGNAQARHGYTPWIIQLLHHSLLVSFGFCWLNHVDKSSQIIVVIEATFQMSDPGQPCIRAITRTNLPLKAPFLVRHRVSGNVCPGGPDPLIPCPQYQITIETLAECIGCWNIFAGPVWQEFKIIQDWGNGISSVDIAQLHWPQVEVPEISRERLLWLERSVLNILASWPNQWRRQRRVEHKTTRTVWFDSSFSAYKMAK